MSGAKLVGRSALAGSKRSHQETTNGDEPTLESPSKSSDSTFAPKTVRTSSFRNGMWLHLCCTISGLIAPLQQSQPATAAGNARTVAILRFLRAEHVLRLAPNVSALTGKERFHGGSTSLDNFAAVLPFVSLKGY